jgi:hypothetical protein
MPVRGLEMFRRLGDYQREPQRLLTGILLGSITSERFLCRKRRELT